MPHAAVSCGTGCNSEPLSDISGAKEDVTETLKHHWPEYVMEAAEIATFMISAVVVTTLIDHPASPVRQAIDSTLLRRLLTGLMMGLTAIALVRSPWGRQSGAHMNPSLTLTFFRLGKIAPWDAAFYVGAQFVGAMGGVAVAAMVMGPAIGIPEVNYVATKPGTSGPGVAFAAELTISFVLMLSVLTLSNTMRLAKLTPFVVGALVATYITIEAPLSGMSMNPARTFGPALFGHIWDSLWVYFAAPPLGMLLAAETYVRVHSRGLSGVWCAKLHHDDRSRCIFRCAHP
jgi:aquaporin Z